MFSKFVFFLVCLFVLSLWFTDSALAQEGIQINGQEASYLFNDELNFHVEYESSANMINGYVFYQFAGSDHTWVYEGQLSGRESLNVAVALESANSPKVFTTIEYWFRFASDRGKFYESPHYSLYYEDNRYEWESLESPPFTLRWHSGNMAFADAILAAAQQSIQRTGGFLQLPAAQPITLHVYDNPSDVQLVAQLAGYEWVAGHNDPAAGVIFMSLAPGGQQSLEIQRQVPHEVAHVMLYQALGRERYINLPAWLIEGIASNVEIYSDPLGSELLSVASETGTLIPLASLCTAFPQNESSARLAYAESASFVDYLFQNYNRTGFDILVEAYAETGDCLNASLSSFGKDLPMLEAEWRQAIFAPPTGVLGDIQTLPWPSIAAGAGVALVLWVLLRRISRSSSRGR